MSKKFIIPILLVLWIRGQAQDTLKTITLDEMVITGTKSEVLVEKSGKTIYKLTRKDMEGSAGKTVADLLNEVPGVQMDGNFGPLGTNISYFVRGASSKRTLILIDGVPFNDPSGIDQTYDLRLLDLDQVESIEVLKGGLSTLYGTGAAAGVINITLRKSAKEGLRASIGAEYASFNTLKTSLSLSGKDRDLNYLVTGGYRQSDGFSAAEDGSGSGNFDNDGFEGYNILGKVGYNFSDQFSLGFTASLDDFETEYDQGAFSDGDNTSDHQQLRVGLSPKYKWNGGHVSGEFFYANLDRLFDSPDFFDPNARFIDKYDGSNMQADLILDQNLASDLKMIGGLNYQNFSYSQPDVDETQFTIIDPYMTFIFDQLNFNVQVGGRLNVHSEYGTNFVYNVNPSYIINVSELSSLKILASYSTSFITPSLYQLYGPYGNKELKPEESRSTEGGLSFYLDKVTLNAVYFYRKDKDLIGFVSNYENLNSETETDGFEFNGTFKVNDQLQFSANYSYVKALNGTTLYKIPKNKFGLSVNYELIDQLHFGMKYLYTGDRVQPYFNPETFMVEDIETDTYNLFDFFASYKIKDITLSGAVNNLFDEEYVAIYGFTTIGRNYSIGVKYHIN